MTFRLKSLFKQAPVLSTAFVIALGMTLWFGGQAATRAIYWADPSHQNQDIAGWMTLGYVGRSWQVPRQDLRAAVQPILPAGLPGRLPPIEKLARDTGVPEAEIINRLNATIAAYRASNPNQP